MHAGGGHEPVDERVENLGRHLEVVAQRTVAGHHQLAERSSISSPQRLARGPYPGVLGDHVSGARQQAGPVDRTQRFQVADVDASLARVTELGGAVVMGAQDTPYGRLAIATDATGGPFKLLA